VLQYLAKLVKTNEPDLLKIHAELPSIGPAESVVVDGLVSELRDLNERLKNVKATAQSEGDRYRASKTDYKSGTALDRLRQQKTQIKVIEDVNMYNQTKRAERTPMEKFVVYAEKRTMEALARTDEVQELFKGVLIYFGEDPAMTSVDFFGTLNKFVGALDGAYEVVKRLEAQKAAEEKKAAAQRAREAARRAQAQNKVVDEPNDNLANATVKGKLDLSGQRKQYADPFAGPENADQEKTEPKSNMLLLQRKQFADPFVGPEEHSIATHENETTPCSVNDPKASPINTKSINDHTSLGAKESPPKNQSMRFFPATSPGNKGATEKTSSRTQRYNDKTSSNARSDKAQTESTEVANNPDPRAALMAMLSKRNLPPPEEIPLPSSVKDTNEANVEEEEVNAQQDPRAALMAMLSKRNLPPPEETPLPSSVKDADEANVEEEEVNAQQDPRAALMAMIAKRSAPPTGDSASPPKGNVKADDEKKQDAQLDPVAALAVNDPSPEESLSTVLIEDNGSQEVESGDGVKKHELQPDPTPNAPSSSPSLHPPEEPAKPVSTEDKRLVDEVVDDVKKQDAQPMLSNSHTLGEKSKSDLGQPKCSPKDEGFSTDDALHRHAVLNPNHEPTSLCSLPDFLDVPSFETTPSTKESSVIQIEPLSITDEKRSIDKASSAASPSNIALMAAAAAKRKSASKGSSTPSSNEKRRSKAKFPVQGSTAPMGIAAMAAAAARQKILLKEAIEECDLSDLEYTNLKS
jgi:hypothetical protein